MAAKQLIAERSELYLPPLEPKVVKEGFDGRLFERKALLRVGGVTPLSAIRLEERLGSFRPDLIVAAPDIEVAVEIARTSFITPEKLEKIKAHGKATVEFDISQLPDFGFQDLEAVLFTPSTSASWAWHPDEAAEVSKLQKLVDAEMAKAQVQWEWEQAETEKFQKAKDEEFALQNCKNSLAGERSGSSARPRNRTRIGFREQLARTQAFAQLSAEEKVESAVQAMGEAGARIREFLPLRVSGSHAITAPPLAWQAPVFASFIHRALRLAETTVEAEAVRGWIRERFAVTGDDKAFGVAVWYFLKGLEELDILHRRVQQKFTVLVPDLLGALAVAEDARTGRCKPLAWVNPENAWPSTEKSEAVANAFTEAFGGAAGWDRISGLLPAVCALKAPEDAVWDYSRVVGGESQERVRRFLLSAGFATTLQD